MAESAQHRNRSLPLAWLLALALLVSQSLSLTAAIEAFSAGAVRANICLANPAGPDEPDSSGHEQHDCCILCSASALPGLVPAGDRLVPPSVARHRGGARPRRARPIDRRRGPGQRHPRAPPR